MQSNCLLLSLFPILRPLSLPLLPATRSTSTLSQCHQINKLFTPHFKSPMARSLASIKKISSLFLDGFSEAIARRGYAVASRSATKGGVDSISGKMAPKTGQDKGVTPYKVSWVPDPVTGCYKPENFNEIDAAELRAMLLVKKFNN